MTHAKETLRMMEDFKAHLSYPMVQAYLDSIIHTETGKAGKGAELALRLRKVLEFADAYYLTQDMQDVVMWAAKTLDETDTFSADLWPSHAGFLLVEDLLLIKEVRGLNMGIKGMIWERANGGTYVTLLSDAQDPRDEVSSVVLSGITEEKKRLFASMGRLWVSRIPGRIRDGEDAGPVEFEVTEDMAIRDDPAFPPLAETAYNVRRIILAFLMLYNQTISAPYRESLRPKDAKRWTKKNLPSGVTVVAMRRIAGAGKAQGESRVEWHHRWVVRGHWRNQPCGPNYPGARQIDGRWYARIWIAPFVKGPEDAPLLMTKKVYALSR